MIYFKSENSGPLLFHEAQKLIQEDELYKSCLDSFQAAHQHVTSLRVALGSEAGAVDPVYSPFLR